MIEGLYKCNKGSGSGFMTKGEIYHFTDGNFIKDDGILNKKKYSDIDDFNVNVAQISKLKNQIKLHGLFECTKEVSPKFMKLGEKYNFIDGVFTVKQGSNAYVKYETMEEFNYLRVTQIKKVEEETKMTTQIEDIKGVLEGNKDSIVKNLLSKIIIKEDLKFSLKGIAVKGKDSYKVYKNGKIIELTKSMTEDNIDLFVALPSKLKDIKENDLIYQNKTYYFVNTIKSDLGQLIGVNVASGVLETLLPVVNVLSASTYTKVFSAIELLGGYSLLNKTQTGILTVMRSLYKNRGNLDEFMHTGFSTTIIPTVVKTFSNVKKYPIVAKYQPQLITAIAGIGIIATNTDVFSKIKGFEMKKLSKKHMVIIVSLLGLIASGIVANKKGVLKQMKAYLIKKDLISKVVKLKELILSKFKK